MKCAVLLSGLLRGYKEAYNSLQQNILDNYDCDLFCSTWDNQDEFYGVDIKNKYIIENTSFNYPASERFYDLVPVKSWCSIYDPKYQEIFPCDNYSKVSLEAYVNECGYTISEELYWIVFNMENILKQWYITQLGSEFFLDEIKHYDYVFRIRFDSTIEHFPFHNLNCNELSIMNTTAYGSSPILKNDTFACGPVGYMYEYLNYYDYVHDYIFSQIDELVSSNWSAGSPIKFKAEYMINNFFIDKNIKVHARDDIKIRHHTWPKK